MSTHPIRRLSTVGLVLQVGILACQGAVAQGRDQAAPLQDSPARSAKMQEDEKPIESLEKTVLRVGDTDVPLTRDDANAIRDALLVYLKSSDYIDRDALIGWTRGSAWIDPDGRLRVGPWLLGAEGKEMILRYREPPGPLAGKAHRATLIRKDGAWTVTTVEMEKIRRR
jgi:hypothetical protein